MQGQAQECRRDRSMLFKLMLETAGSCMITHQVGNNRCSASATLGFRNSARLSPENLRPESPPLVPLTRARGSGKLLRSAPPQDAKTKRTQKKPTRALRIEAAPCLYLACLCSKRTLGRCLSGWNTSILASPGFCRAILGAPLWAFCCSLGEGM